MVQPANSKVAATVIKCGFDMGGLVALNLMRNALSLTTESWFVRVARYEIQYALPGPPVERCR